MSNLNDDISRLTKFSDKLENKMDYFITHRSTLFFNHGRLRGNNEIQLLLKAWENTKPRFNDLKNYLVEFRPSNDLESVGLTGSELNLKLYLVEESLRELMNEEEKFEMIREKKDSGKGFRIWHGLRRLKNNWEKYFDHADTIIGSLSAVGIPGSEGISELKKVIEKFLRWWKKR